MSKCTLGNLFRLRDGGAEQGVLMEAATRLQYRMRGEEVAAAFVLCMLAVQFIILIILDVYCGINGWLCHQAEESWSKQRQHMVAESRVALFEQQVNFCSWISFWMWSFLPQVKQLRSAFPGMDDDMATSEVSTSGIKCIESYIGLVVLCKFYLKSAWLIFVPGVGHNCWLPSLCKD